MSPLVRGEVCHILTEKIDPARGGRKLPIDQIEKRRLACTIWPDDGQSLSDVDRHRHIVDRTQTTKILGQSTCAKNELI